VRLRIGSYLNTTVLSIKCMAGVRFPTEQEISLFVTTHRPVSVGVTQQRVQGISPALLLGLGKMLHEAAHSTQSSAKVYILPPRPYTPPG
jgi:hypothetical protein